MTTTIANVYHGHRDQSRPFSLVVRHGTRGTTRQDLERELMKLDLGPCETKDEALLLKLMVSERLRPFTDVSKFGGYV